MASEHTYTLSVLCSHLTLAGLFNCVVFSCWMIFEQCLSGGQSRISHTICTGFMIMVSTDCIISELYNITLCFYVTLWYVIQYFLVVQILLLDFFHKYLVISFSFLVSLIFLPYFFPDPWSSAILFHLNTTLWTKHWLHCCCNTKALVM